MRTYTRQTKGRTAWITSVLLAVQMVLLAAGAWAFGADLPVTAGPYSKELPRNNASAVATDNKGNVFVLYGAFELNQGWNQEFLPMVRIFDAESATWLPPFEISEPSERTVCWWHLAVASDCMDNVHFIWVQMGATHQLWYRVRYADGSWGSRELIQGVPGLPAGQIDRPSLAADRHGNVFVCWAQGLYNTDSSYLHNILWSVRDAETDLWTPADYLTFYVVGVDSSPGAMSPSIATQARAGSRNTVAHVAWNDWIEGHVGTAWIRRNAADDPGGVTYDTSPAPVYMSAERGDPSISVHCDQIHLMWNEWNTGGTLQHRIGTATGLPGGITWIDPGPTGLPAAHPNITTDGIGNVHAVIDANPVTYARFSHRDQIWTDVTSVNDLSAFTRNPLLAVHERGGVHVVWLDSRGGPGAQVYYDRGDCMILPVVPEGPDPVVASLEIELQAALLAAHPFDRIPVIVQMRESIDYEGMKESVRGMTPSDRKESVVAQLRTMTETSQRELRRELAAAERIGKAGEVRPFWSVNAIAARLSPETIRSIAARSDIETILLDVPAPMIEAPAFHRSDTGGTGRSAERPTDPPARVPLPPMIAWNVEAIDAHRVWADGYIGECITVAVLDTGVDLGHLDLSDNIWTNLLESGGSTGVDDDANGYLDDINGWNTVDWSGAVQDDHGHGTHVSGTIAGNGSGGIVTGVAPGARILPVKVCDAAGACSNGDIIDGIQYAIANGAQILNLSLGRGCRTAAERRLFRMEADAVELMGITMCVAAGNDNCRQSEPNVVTSPGDIPPPWISPDQPDLGMTSGVTTVGATGYRTDAIAPFSSRGPVDWSQTAAPYGDWMLCDPVTPNVGLIKPDIVAPGVRIPSTQLGGGYVGEDLADPRSGTSMATPHIAGVAALILSKNGGLLNRDIHRIIELTASDLGSSGKDNTFGAGKVNALAALAAVAVPDDPAITMIGRRYNEIQGNGDGRLDAGEIVEIEIRLQNNTLYTLGDLFATLSSPSNVVVLDNRGIFGDIVPGGALWNAADPFRIRIPADVVEGEVAIFNFAVDSHGACPLLSFSDTLHAETGPCEHIVDHQASGVRFSVTDQGIAGFLTGEQAVGSGFVYPKVGGSNRLYIGSFWAGTDPGYALNRDYDDDPVKDWRPLGCITLRGGLPGDPITADEVAIGAYDDGGHPSPRGLRVVQRSYAKANPPDDDFVIVTYEMTGTGTAQLHSVWPGLFMDWDLDEAGGYTSNRGGVDPLRDMVYMWREGGGDGAYVGIRTLSHKKPLQMSLIRNSTYIWPSGYLSDSDRYHFLSGDLPEYRVTSTPVADDWSAVIGIAPFTIMPGESLLVSFAVLAGSSLADLRANADAAALLWASGWGAPADLDQAGEVDLPATVMLAPPQPNPFGLSTTLRFDLPREMEARLEIFDVAGRKVAELLDGPVPAGRHARVWTGADLSGRVAASGLYYARLRTAEGDRIQKILLAR